MKILYFDCETTGTNAERNDIVQLSGMFEIDGEIVEEFNLRCQPFIYETVQKEALEVTGLTIEEIKKYPTPQETYKKFLTMLDRHISKYDKKDKFYPAGYNVRFDLDFLGQFFKKNGNSYFGSYCNWRAIDGLPIMHFLEACGKVKLEDYKLGTVCAHYGIPIDAHDAMSDIKATKTLIEMLKVQIGGKSDT